MPRLIACPLTFALLAVGAFAPDAAEGKLRKLSQVGVKAGTGTLSGKQLAVRLRLRQRTRVRLEVTAGKRVVARARSKTLKKGRRRVVVTLNRQPAGAASLRLRVTATNLKTRKTGRGSVRLKVTPARSSGPGASPAPNPTPTPTPGGGSNRTPTDIALTPGTVAENEPAGTTAGTLTALDADKDDFHRFTLVRGEGDTDNALFTIDGAELRTAAPLDFELKPSLSVRVRVVDPKAGVFEKVLKVTVIDRNEAPTAPVLSAQTVSETAPPGTVVGVVSATDPDAGQTLTFSLVSGPGDTDNASFAIDGTALETATALDFETQSSYTVRIQADDGQGGIAAEQFSIVVTDAVEGATATLAATPLQYTENAAAVPVDAGLVVTAPDGSDITGATVRVSSGFQVGDVLGYATVNGITGSYTAGTGVLTLTGTASPAAYQQALRTVTFRSDSQAPTTSKAIEVVLHQGPSSGAPATRAVSVAAVNDPPVADADAFGGGQQGVRMRVGSTHADTHEIEVAGDVLAGDTDVDTPETNLSVTPGTITTADGGTVVMASNGSFTYDPPAGDDGADSFTYTVEDNDTGDSDGTEDTHTATVTITQAGPRVWFVDDTAAAGGRGVSHAPLQSLEPLATGGAHDARDGSGDHIFVYSGTYPSGIALETNQKLLGQPHGLNVGGHQLVAPGGTAPAISHPGASVVTLGSGNELQDLALGDGTTSLAGGSIGTTTIDDTSIANTGGAAIEITSGGTLTAAFNSVSSSNSPGVGVGLTGLAGTIALGAGAIQNATGTDFHVSGGGAAITYGGAITDGTGRLVNIDGTTGGSRTFNGAVSDTTDNDNGSTGVRINSAAGPNSFAGGLKLSTGADHALEVIGSSGTTTVPGTTVNTLKTTSGSALRALTSAVSLTFQRIDSTGGNTHAGVHLDGVSGGGLTVTGAGAPGTGGTIANKSGADLSPGGHGIHLNNVSAPVSLSRMQLNDFGNFAIRGTAVSGEFDLVDSNISGVSGTSTAVDEAAIAFSQLTGAGHQILRTNVSGGFEDNIQVRNSSGTLNRLHISGPATIGAHGSTEGNDSIGMTANGTASFNATVENMTVTSSRGDMIGVNASGTAASDLVLNGNTLHNALPQASIAGAGGGNTITVDQSADLTYSITSNSMRNSKGTTLLVHQGFGGVSGNGTLRGTIQGNTIGQSGIVSSSSTEGSGIQVSMGVRGAHTALIRSNSVHGYANHGIALLAQGFGTSSTGLPVHDGDLNATVKGNTVNTPSAPAGGLAQNGIHLNTGSNGAPTDNNDAYDICVDIGSSTIAADRNNITGSGALGGTEIRVRQRFAADILMPGYSGTLTDTTAVRTYLEARQNMTPGSSSASYQGPGGGYANTSSCTLP